MSEILIQSKVTAPRLNSKIVHRGRLTSLLHENTDKSLIIVCAPAGFGKTTLVLDYLSSYKNKHAWFSIPHKGIEDASTFFEYLIGSVNNINEKFGKDTLDVLKQFNSNPKMSKELVYACTASFVNEFQKCFKEEDIILIIDDLHYIESDKSKAGLKEFLTELLDNIPSNLHLVIVSRVMPDINLTTLKAKRNVSIVDDNELYFTKEETEQLLKDIYKVSYDDKDIKVLDENIKGWVTGLHLLLQAYGEDFTRIKYEGNISYKNIFEFFAQEIFDNLDSELQEFLMVTSLMETFDDGLVNSVLGITNSRELTDELIHKNLFIHQINTDHKSEKYVTYGYHALFREFLNNKLKKSKIEDEIKNLMEKIGDSYAEYGDEISAVNYYLDSKNFEKSISLIEKLLKELINSGKYEIAYSWINSIPTYLLNRSDLLFYLGKIEYHLNGNVDEALKYLNKAENLYKKENNEDGTVFCLSIKFVLYAYSGKINDAKTELEDALTWKLSPLNQIEVIRNLAYVYIHIFEFNKAMELSNIALELSNKNNINKDQFYLIKGQIYYSTGEYKKAIDYFEKSKGNNLSFENEFKLVSNIAVCYAAMSEYSNAIISFKKLLAINEKYKSKLNNLIVLCSYALCLICIGDFSKAKEILINLFKLTKEINLIYYLLNIIDSLVWLALLEDDKPAYTKYLKLLREYAEKNNLDFYLKIYELRETLFLMKYDFSMLIENKLLNLYDYFKSKNHYYSDDIILYLSIYYLNNGNIKQSIDNLCLYMENNKFAANDLIIFRNIIDFGLSISELKQLKSKIHNSYFLFFDRLNIEGTSEEYKHKMRVQIENLYDLKMKAFGGLEFISRGVVIPESKWRRKKSKSILAYMMLDAKKKYSREKLTDMFFSDTKAKNIDDIFRHEISSINNTVKLPYLSILQHEGKMLFLNPDCYFKSDVTEFDKLYRIINYENTNKEEKIKACMEAIELYKGEFMKDNYEKWCEDLRDQYRNKYISISELLLELLYETKDIKNLIHYSEKLLTYDKLNEHAYLKLVEAHVESGKIRTAKETYSKMLKIFEEELAEKPDHKVISRIKDLIQ